MKRDEQREESGKRGAGDRVAQPLPIGKGYPTRAEGSAMAEVAGRRTACSRSRRASAPESRARACTPPYLPGKSAATRVAVSRVQPFAAGWIVA